MGYEGRRVFIEATAPHDLRLQLRRWGWRRTRRKARSRITHVLGRGVWPTLEDTAVPSPSGRKLTQRSMRTDSPDPKLCRTKPKPSSHGPRAGGEKHLQNLSQRGSPDDSLVRNLPASAGDTGSIPGLGRPCLSWSNEATIVEPVLESPCSTTREALQ